MEQRSNTSPTPPFQSATMTTLNTQACCHDQQALHHSARKGLGTI